MPNGAHMGNGAVVREPGGAMVALIYASELADAAVVLHMPDASRAAQIHVEVFGWTLPEQFE